MKKVKVTFSEFELIDKSYEFLLLLGQQSAGSYYDNKYSVYVYFVTEEFYNKYCND